MARKAKGSALAPFILLARRKSVTTQPSLHISFRFHDRLLSLKRRAIGRPNLGEITVGSGRNASPCHTDKSEKEDRSGERASARD